MYQTENLLNLDLINNSGARASRTVVLDKKPYENTFENKKRKKRINLINILMCNS
jgi:hypothetical protein